MSQGSHECFSMQEDGEDVEREAVGVKDTLKSWRMGAGQMTHCMFSVEEETMDKVWCSTDNLVSRYCFVGAMDEKGSIPDNIQKVMYLLHMVQKWYENVRPGANSRANDGAPVFIGRAQPFSSYTHIEKRSFFHKSVVDGTMFTHKLFRMRVHIEHCIAKGDVNRDKFFAFLVVEVPLTFDLVDAVEKTCRRTGLDRKMGDEMRDLWVDVASSHFGMGAYESKNKEIMIDAVFENMLDPDSEYYFSKRFRVPVCIRDTRRFMRVWARAQANDADAGKGAYVQVTLVHVDKVCGGHCAKDHFDDAWVAISDVCCSELYTRYNEYTKLMQAYEKQKRASKRKRDDSDALGDDVDMDNGSESGESEEPVFDPPVVYSYPTLINFDSEDTSTLMTQLAVISAHKNGPRNMSALAEHLSRHEGVIEMRGFPRTDITVGINTAMLRPTGSCYVRFSEWLVDNKGCELPPDITRAILMTIYQRKASLNPSVSLLSTDTSTLPRCILTTDDLRRMLHSTDSHQRGKLLCNRSRYIYDRCRVSFLESSVGTQRVYAFARYVDSTAIPLASATAKSDNGMNGGSDPRVSVFNDIGEYCMPGSQKSCLYSIFEETVSKVLKKYVSSEWCMREAPDSLLHTLFLYNATLANANQNYNLKGNNMQLLTMLMISDIGHTLSYNESNFGMAKNGIGHTLHIKNFNGSIIRIDENGAEDTNTTKRFGVGADNTINKYIEAQNPSNNNVPHEIDISKYTTIDNLVGASGMGLWYQYSELYTRHKRLNSITTVPPLVYCTELPVSDNKMQSSADPGGTMYGKMSMLLARQTDTATGTKRAYTSKNDASQDCEAATQEQLCYMRVLAFCHNEEARGDLKRHTVDAVITPIPSATVDVDDAHDDGEDSETMLAGDDMGDAGRFVGTKNNPCVTRTHPYFFSVQGLAQVVGSIQRIGLLGVIADGFEGSIMNLLSNVVYMNRSWMTVKSACPSSRGRQNEKVQARMPAVSILMHAAATFLHPSIAVMSWADIVSITTLNWCSNPCPSALYPMFVSQLVANTFDWSVWLVLAVFVDYFKVPDIGSDVVEELFSTDFSHSPPMDPNKTRKLLKWIESIGLNAGGDSNTYEVVYQAENEPLLARTAVYVTNKWDPDAGTGTSSTPLVVNVERGGSTGGHAYGNRDKSSSSIRATTAWKVAEAVAAKMFVKYRKHLVSACNIDSVLDFTTMIYRITNRALHYPKFGGIPCGTGFQSMENVLKGLGSARQGAAVYGQLNSESYVDGGHASVNKHMHSARASYEVAPVSIVNREGSVWCMCVDVRFLILVKGLLGPRPAVSQMSIQGIFDTLVAWTVRGRLPNTIFCENKFITTHPDNTGSGLNIVDVSSRTKKRPHTMTRPMPNQAIEERSPNVLPGVVNGQLPEDFLIVGHMKRLADRVSDKALSVHYSHVHMEMLNLPSMPSDTWVPLQFVQKTVEEGVEFDASMAPFKNAACFLNSESKRVTLVCSDVVRDPSDTESMAECKRLQTAYNAQGTVVGVDASSTQAPETHVTHAKTARELLCPDTLSYVRFRPTFNRPGILIRIPTAMFYSTLVPWNATEVVQNSEFHVSDSFMNPCSMTYLVNTEEVTPGKLWPAVIGEPESLCTDNSCVYMSLCSDIVEKFLVPVGSMLYLDVEHECVPASLRNGLVCTAVLHQGDTDKFDNIADRKMGKSDFLVEFGHEHDVHVLVECMLIYELPDTVLRFDTSKIKAPVWVSVVVKSITNSREKRSVRHIAVPTRAIIDVERLHSLGVLPVVCQKYT